MTPDGFLSLLQFADGLFPAGAFAHSMGLETYARSEAISTADEVKVLVEAQLECAAGPLDAVAMLLAMKAACAGELGELFALDEMLDAMKCAAELRAASRQMGRQAARIACALVEDTRLSEFFRRAEAERTPGHHAISFGLVGAVLGWEARAAGCAYLYGAAALMVAAAVKLMPLGQTAGQRILWSLHPLIARLAQQAEEKTAEQMWSFAPALEIAAMRHGRLEGRLFRS
jgi:urease accessory protein